MSIMLSSPVCSRLLNSHSFHSILITVWTCLIILFHLDRALLMLSFMCAMQLNIGRRASGGIVTCIYVAGAVLVNSGIYSGRILILMARRILEAAHVFSENREVYGTPKEAGAMIRINHRANEPPAHNSLYPSYNFQ